MASTKKIQEKNGIWYLAHEGKKIPGKLVIDSKAFSLTLFLYTNLDFNGNKIETIKRGFENIEVLFGEVDIRMHITLQNCRLLGASRIGDIWELRYKPEVAFLDGHLINQSANTFYEVTCSYPYLSSWYDTNRLYFGSFSVDSDRMKPALSSEDLFDQIEIDDTLSIIIEREYFENAFLMKKEVSSSIQHFVRFKSTYPRTFEEFRKLAFQFLQLIQLSTGKLGYIDFVSASANPKDIRTLTQQIKTKDNYPYLPIVLFDKDQRRNRRKSDYIHQNMMLFYGGDNRKQSLNNIIGVWYKTYNTYSSIYNRFLDTFEWLQGTDATLSHVMFYNRFLNLIQALESYHLITYPDFNSNITKRENERIKEILKHIENSEDREWLFKKISLHVPLKKRLQDLMHKHLLFITSEIFLNKKDRDSFIFKVKRVRDDLSHGREVDIPEQDIGEYYEKALLMLLSCILLSLGLNEEQAKQAIFSTHKYEQTIAYIQYTDRIK